MAGTKVHAFRTLFVLRSASGVGFRYSIVTVSLSRRRVTLYTMVHALPAFALYDDARQVLCSVTAATG